MATEHKIGNKVVFGIFNNRANLESAIEALKLHGFLSTDISALLPSAEGTQELAHEKHTKAPEGATTGAVTGAALGGALGWLVGMGALAIPGIGPFVAAGPLLASLAGAGVGGTVGGVAGAMIGMGIPEYEAKRFESVIRDGGLLLSVHANSSDMVLMAKEVFKHAGAHDISSTHEEKVADSEYPFVEGSQRNPPPDSRTRIYENQL